MKGTVFNIQRFSVNDGPGVRTTVFLKGCPLRCAWCHNPEGLSPRPQLYFDAQKCVGCSACVQACAEGCHEMRDGRHRLSLEKCRGCGACAEACAFGALSLYGQAVETESVMKTVLRDLPFYENKGGLTISGGEPLMQAQFSCKLLDLARAAGIHCCVESSGYGDQEAARAVFERADLVLIDCKHTEAESLRYWTGARLERIEAAYGLLLELHKPAVLRCPVIPGVNDTRAHFEGIARIVQKYQNIQAVEVMAYHSLGEGKRTALGMDRGKAFSTPTPEQSQAWVDCLAGLISRVPVSLG